MSNRLDHIQPSPTLTLNAEAIKLKASGIDVINLTLGESDFSPPEWVLEAVVRGIHERVNHAYTPSEGRLSLRTSIVRDVERAYKLQYEPQQVIVSTGAKHVIFNALLATLNEGDEVIIPRPYWVSYPDMVRLMGGKPVFVSEEINDDELSAAITSRTKWIIINSPNNPTGRIISQTDLSRIAVTLEKHPHVSVLCDDIYQDLIYDGQSFVSLPMVASKELLNRTLIVHGLSKTFAMTGWRVGYGVGSLDLIRKMGMVQSQSTSNACAIAQTAAEAALNGPRDFLVGWRAEYQTRRDLCLKRLSECGISIQGAAGAFYIWIPCDKLYQKLGVQSDAKAAEVLLKQYHLALVPGSAFGVPNYLRLSYTTPTENLSKAMDQLVRILV